MVFWTVEMLLPFLKLILKEETYFLNINPLLVTYSWEGLLTKKITLRKGFYDISDQNGGLVCTQPLSVITAFRR